MTAHTLTRPLPSARALRRRAIAVATAALVVAGFVLFAFLPSLLVAAGPVAVVVLAAVLWTIALRPER